jgi:hypothetical protein
MSKDLHVFTGGLDPFVFFVDSVQVHVHAGSPGGLGGTPADPNTPGSEPAKGPILDLPPLEPPYEAAFVAMPGESEALRMTIDQLAEPGEHLRMVLDHSGDADTDLAQFGAVFSGLDGAQASDVTLYYVAGSGESSG